MKANHYVCNDELKGNVFPYRCELCMKAEHTNFKLNGGCNYDGEPPQVEVRSGLHIHVEPLRGECDVVLSDCHNDTARVDE